MLLRKMMLILAIYIVSQGGRCQGYLVFRCLCKMVYWMHTIIFTDDALEKDVTQESADNNENSKEETLVEADGPPDCDSDYSMSELDQSNSTDNSKSLKSSKDSQNKSGTQTTKQKGKQRKRQTDLENKNVKKNKKKKLN